METDGINRMSPLKRALIEKAGHDHGFEHVLPSHSSVVSLGSARHPGQVHQLTNNVQACLVRLNGLVRQVARVYAAGAYFGFGVAFGAII